MRRMQVLYYTLAVLLACCLVLAEDKDKDAKTKDEDRPKVFKRLIPADVLRGQLKGTRLKMDGERSDESLVPVRSQRSRNLGVWDRNVRTVIISTGE
ncbi:hypothetical protein J6590_049168 [Homalodisca vitripennis]|nr:hypothetical protein J6590_049168 [Homalodisca vitripennis]